MFEFFWLYVHKSLCSNVKRHHWSERLTLDKRLGAWHQVHRHSKSEWCRTAEWVYQIQVNSDRNEHTTRYRKSTSLDDSYVPDEDVEVVPRHTHPVHIRESNYGVRSLQEYRVSASILPSVAPDRVTALHRDELWASD